MTQAVRGFGKRRPDGVYAAKDGRAGGVNASMKGAGVKPLPPVTGQDAEQAAIQRILTGEQYMTVYKAIKPEAETAAELAILLLEGKPAPADMTRGKVVNNGKKDVPSMLLDPVAVTAANVKATAIMDGFWAAE